MLFDANATIVIAVRTTVYSTDCLVSSVKPLPRWLIAIQNREVHECCKRWEELVFLLEMISKSRTLHNQMAKNEGLVSFLGYRSALQPAHA